MEAEKWWSLQPLSRPDPPPVKLARTPIDAFILAKLQEHGLQPSAEADRRTLIRRVTYDLHGLPPTPEEVDAFVSDQSSTAYEKLVDRLLASPRYGERWGRHWLDAAHYGESHGYDKDKPRRNAWPYRDYVITSFNEDKPYARFVQEQLAGDVMFPDDPDATIALGFIAAGPWDYVGQAELREGTTDKNDHARARPRRYGDRGHVLSRQHDRALCPVPRSQIRSHPPGGLLQPAGRICRRRSCGPAV